MGPSRNILRLDVGDVQASTVVTSISNAMKSKAEYDTFAKITSLANLRIKIGIFSKDFQKR